MVRQSLQIVSLSIQKDMNLYRQRNPSAHNSRSLVQALMHVQRTMMTNRHMVVHVWHAH